MSIEVTAFTDTGLVRDHNEDALLVGAWSCQAATGSVVHMRFGDDVPFVAAVADGMGGHAGGELASRLALSVIADIAPGWAGPDDVADGLQHANDQVHQVGQNPELLGMGTTIAGVCAFADQVVVFNVGDSRVYGISDGVLQQLSVDDALLDDQGRPTHRITQALGQRMPVDPHLTVQPRAGTAYLVCSDGVSGMMSDEALRDAVTGPSPAETIIEATRKAGAQDNFSFLLISLD